MKTVLIVILVEVLTVLAAIPLIKVVKQDYALYKLESECVRYYIARGNERKDIITTSGTCHLRN